MSNILLILSILFIDVSLEENMTTITEIFSVSL